MHTMCETSCLLEVLEVLPSDRHWAQVNELRGGSLCGASAVWAGSLDGHCGPCARLCLICRSCQSLGKLLKMFLKACTLPSERPWHVLTYWLQPAEVYASFILGASCL